MPIVDKTRIATINILSTLLTLLIPKLAMLTLSVHCETSISLKNANALSNFYCSPENVFVNFGI